MMERTALTSPSTRLGLAYLRIRVFFAALVFYTKNSELQYLTDLLRSSDAQEKQLPPGDK